MIVIMEIIAIINSDNIIIIIIINITIIKLIDIFIEISAVIIKMFILSQIKYLPKELRDTNYSIWDPFKEIMIIKD